MNDSLNFQAALDYSFSMRWYPGKHKNMNGVKWKDLPEEERARLLRRVPPFDYYPLSTFWDRDNRSTWEYFKDNPHTYLLRPNRRPFQNGKKILYVPVFELYSIGITKLDPYRRDFNMILLSGRSTRYIPLVIYKRLEGEEIIGDRPLNLMDPLRLPDAECSLTIALSNPINGGWWFAFDPRSKLRFNPPPPREEDVKYDEPLSTLFKDRASDSEAFISYEIITEAVKAKLVFRFIPLPPPPRGRGGGEEECPIQILSGTIFATNNRNPNTRRIVKDFSSRPVVPVVPKAKHVLPLDRYVFGVPKGSNFQVTAEDLICIQQGGSGSGSRFRISGTLDFDVPTHSRSEEKFFTSTGTTTRLCLTVFWSAAIS